MPKESPINLRRKLWIGNKVVDENFQRYSSGTDPYSGEPQLTLTDINRQTATFHPFKTPILIEHQADTSDGDRKVNVPLNHLLGSDRRWKIVTVQPSCFEDKKADDLTPTDSNLARSIYHSESTNPGSDDIKHESGLSLESKGIISVIIRSTNNACRYPSKLIKCMITNPHTKRLVFYWENPDGFIRGTRYSLNKSYRNNTYNDGARNLLNSIHSFLHHH